MKKIALTSLLAVFAVSGAGAANLVNSPLYLPEQNHFASVTSLGSHTRHDQDNNWNLNERFMYGVTDKLAVGVNADFDEDNWFDSYGWDSISFDATYRFLNKNGLIADAIAGYGVAGVWPYHMAFLDKNETEYSWWAGFRTGYTTNRWTIAGHANFVYLTDDSNGSESFNWNDEGLHVLAVGIDGQYLLDSHWNVVAGIEYMGVLDDENHTTKIKDAGSWTGNIGMNYNIGKTKYVGVYVNGELEHDTGDWEFVDGFGFGARFGIDF